jgi:hypothetical protein
MTARGSTANPPIVAVRVFAHALQSASNPDQWKQWLPIIKENCSKEIFEEMESKYHITADGKQGGPASHV